MKWLSIPKIILLILALSGGVAWGIYQNHQHSSNEVLVTIPHGVQYSVYKDMGGDGAYNYSAKQPPLLTLNFSKKVLLKRGVYDFVIKNAKNQYTNPVTRETVSYGTNKITLQPTYTKERLSSLLPGLRPEIQKALYDQYPDIKQTHSITKNQLYVMGNWYGAVLTPKDPSLDVLKIIMQKNNNAWRSAVEQPMISIGEPAHPRIPASVVKQVDGL